MAEPFDYVLNFPGKPSLKFDGYTGKLSSDLNEADSLFWVNEISGAFKAIAAAFPLVSKATDVSAIMHLS
ncbi:hypothetical protein LGH82_28730 [Mesorhizobium sp. PAMC28654]|uniref:hypothetical protein n=1 Tax=Mesorhizobium sp. PAMC28654 TaxID=2880934 RepID=UPI001D0B1C2D|nr:hypothetical protein [Mesorhizobium sp. PAMC28654]UDL89031.1 hypothetical protein LGH82_28730 [Mesorhizobium sp. PAMC28654]